MHPSKAVALCFLVVSTLSFVEWALVEQFSTALPALFLAVGSAFLFVSSIYGLVRYESNPIVTEYEPTAYVLLVACAVWILGVVLSIGAHFS